MSEVISRDPNKGRGRAGVLGDQINGMNRKYWKK